MNKKLTAVLAAALLAVVGTAVPVYAGETGAADDGITCSPGDTEKEVSAVVDYTQSSTFTVSIPKSVQISSGKRSAGYTVSVSGDIASDESVWVIPRDLDPETDGINFFMEDTDTKSQAKDEVIATIIQEKTAWNARNAACGYSFTGSTVTAEDLSAGNWEGLLYFDITLHKHSFRNGFCTCGESDLAAYTAGLYDAAGNQLISWNSLVQDYGLDVEGDYHSPADSGTLYGILSMEEMKDISDAAVELVIPSGITRIGDQALARLSSLKEISIPDTVEEIGEWACGACSSLEYINIPDSVKTMGTGAFAYCGKATSVHISRGISSLPEGAFSFCAALTSAYIPDNVTEIGKSAFQDCGHLETVRFPDGLASLPDYVFRGCAALQSVELPDTVTSIGSNTFQYCDGLKTVDLSSVTEIGPFAFQFCAGLETAVLSEDLQSVGWGAFDSDTKLTVTLPSGVQSVGKSAFCLIKHLYYDGDLDGAPWGASAWGTGGLYTDDGTLVISWDNLLEAGLTPYTDLTDTSNCLLKEGAAGCLRTILYDNGTLKEEYKDVATLIVPGGAGTAIGSWVFYNCPVLKTVVLPDNIQTIGKDAFRACSGLKSITMKGVASIDYEAFYGCTSLEDIGSASSLKTIGASAFASCTAFGEIVLPDTVTSIGKYAFSGCKNAAVTVPSTVESIGTGAFNSVPHVYYDGSLSSSNNWGAKALN